MGWREDYKNIIKKTEINALDEDPIKNILEHPIVHKILEVFDGPGTKIVDVYIDQEKSENENASKTHIKHTKPSKTRFGQAINLVQQIELEALSKGWSPNQLWNTVGWYNEQGLVCFLDGIKEIGEITPDYIEIKKKLHNEDIITTNFNNPRKIGQPVE